MSFRFPLSALALSGVLVLSACDATPVDPPNEGELITEVSITLTNAANAADVLTITASDPDGDGAGITFSPASVTLRSGATYTGTITIRNTIANEDITEEIRDEAEAHLFLYTFSPAALGSASPSDLESQYTAENTNGGDFAVGLRFAASVAASATGSGTLDVQLFHFDTTPKTSSTATSDEIDLDIAFPVTVTPPVLARDTAAERN